MGQVVIVPRRAKDWPERLAAHLAEGSKKLSVWGENDCAMDAANWVLRCLGVDFAAEYRGTYGDEEGAARRLSEVDGGSLMSAARRALGRPRRSVFEAGRGDLALVDIGGGQLSLGIVDTSGRRVAVVARPPLVGYARFPLSAAKAVWEV